MTTYDMIYTIKMRVEAHTPKRAAELIEKELNDIPGFIGGMRETYKVIE